MFNVRFLTEIGFKGSLFNLRVRAVYIKVFGILNSFRLEFKIKTRVFKD
jgi:hypothetical protein